MFPELQKKFVALYTLSTGSIMTFILCIALLFYVSSQENQQKSAFQEHLFALTSKLQTDSRFSDSYLAQMEQNNRLLIYIEENNSSFFFPGAYKPLTSRDILLDYAQGAAQKESIYPDSQPISSSLLQSSIFQINGDRQDTYLGNMLILRTSSGYKKMILLQDVTKSQKKIIETGCIYLLIDLFGILILFLTGRRFVRRSLRPLEETYQKQQDFVAAASHELRSPLTVIQATADAITARPEDCSRYLSVIKSECSRGSSLIKNLLLLVTAERKEWAVKKQRFEIDELLLNLLELYEPLCMSKGGRLLLALPETPIPSVLADPELCRQIITILLDNAIAYTLDAEHYEPKIILQAMVSQEHVIIYVIDHGPGISEEEKELIFDRFYRNDSSRSDKGHFGLGLSIAAALARMQGIRLSVEDTAGGGTTFSVKI